MGRAERRHLVTGIGMATAGGASVVVTPLTCSFSLNTAATVINVAGASGDLATGNGLIFVGPVSGGTPPYFDNGSVFTDDGNTGSTTLNFVLAPFSVHNTIAWASMVVGDFGTFHYDYSVMDSGSPPQFATYRYPPTGVIAIHRTT
jgi:hypothetical protein